MSHPFASFTAVLTHDDAVNIRRYANDDGKRRMITNDDD